MIASPNVDSYFIVMALDSSAPAIDVDNLAQEKVQEVEKILDGQDDLKLDSIRSCFSILMQIITAADLHRTNEDSDREKSKNTGQTKTENSESIYADYADDYEQFNAVDLTEQFATNSVKWTIRVRAFKCVHRIFNKLIDLNKSSIVLKILPDLVRLSFVAATSPYDDLKVQGFQMFRELINRFASVEEREFPGHSILEQYKTQVLTALKPAFNLDAPPYITAIACQVCSQWMCRGLERDVIGLRRAYQLIEPSIEKLETQSINPNNLLYQEIELEQERLDILGSWAQLYIKAHEPGETSKPLGDLINDHIETLVAKWWEALKEYALLIMLSTNTMTASHDNEHVYTREVALRLFTPIWPKLTLAVTTWLCKPITLANKVTESKKYFRFICGLLMNEFCKCLQMDPMVIDSLPESAIMALRSFNMLLSDETVRMGFLEDVIVAREFYSALGGMFMRWTNLKSGHKSLLMNSMSNIFKIILSKFKDDDKIMQHTLAQLMESVRAGKERLPTTPGQRLMLANLIVVTKSRPDLLEADEKLSREFTEITTNEKPSEKSIDSAPKTVTNDRKDSKTAKKLGKVTKKPSNSIVLKSDFSNFYSSQS